MTKVANCKNNVVAKIGEKLRLHPESARVIGSWDRDTLTRYLKEADVEVMIVHHHGENRQWDSGAGTGAALQRFKTILDAAYPNPPCRVDQHCVTMRLPANADAHYIGKQDARCANISAARPRGL